MTLTLEIALERLAPWDQIMAVFMPKGAEGPCPAWHFPRKQVIESMKTAGFIGEGGEQAQQRDIGIYIPFVHRDLGEGLLFIQTAPSAQQSPQQLRKVIDAANACEHVWDVNSGWLFCRTCRAAIISSVGMPPNSRC